jgi:hypothetical protein
MGWTKVSFQAALASSIPVSHWTRESSRCFRPIGLASASDRKYTTSPASSVNWCHADCVSDRSSWNEHSFHCGFTCSFGRPLCAPAVAWASAMVASAIVGISSLIGASSGVWVSGSLHSLPQPGQDTPGDVPPAQLEHAVVRDVGDDLAPCAVGARRRFDLPA